MAPEAAGTMDRKPDPRPGFAAFTPRRTCATAGDMPDFKKLLRTAVAETLAMQRRPFDDWRREGRLLAPSIMGLAAEGSYRTSRAGIEALAELAEGFRRVDKARARSVSEKSAFLAANITLGEMLPSLGRDSERKDWVKFREALRARLEAGRTCLMHYLPAWLFVRQDAVPFDVGPVRFLPRQDWFAAVEARRGERSPLLDSVEALWRGDAPDSVQDPIARAVAASVQPDQWVACVEVDGCEPDESARRALVAARAAVDAVRVVVGAPENARIGLARDHGPPLAVDRLVQSEGRDPTHGFALNWRGLGGEPGMAAAVVEDSADFRRCAGARIALYLRPEPDADRGCPKLSDRWVNALSLYGLACAGEADFAALVNYVMALDVLTRAGEERGIAMLAARLFRMGVKDAMTGDGTTLERVVERLWGHRSQLAHGSLLGLDENLRLDRALAANFATNVVGSYALQLDRYASAGGEDDPEAFLEWLAD